MSFWNRVLALKYIGANRIKGDSRALVILINQNVLALSTILIIAGITSLFIGQPFLPSILSLFVGILLPATLILNYFGYFITGFILQTVVINSFVIALVLLLPKAVDVEWGFVVSGLFFAAIGYRSKIPYIAPAIVIVSVLELMFFGEYSMNIVSMSEREIMISHLMLKMCAAAMIFLQFYYWLSSHSEISNRIQWAKNELEMQKNLLYQIIENSPSSVSVRDLEGNLLVSSHQNAGIEDSFIAADSGSIRNDNYFELHDSQNGRDQFFLIQRYPLGDFEGKHFATCTFATDITDQKMVHLALTQKAKMSSLGEMAGGVAHEINNPLAIISGRTRQIRLLSENTQLDAKRLNEELNKIDQTVNRIARIIKGLRSFSRNSDEDPFVSVSTASIVKDTLDLCQERFRNHSIKLHVKECIDVSMECKAPQIIQVLLNLLNNAVDAVENTKEPWVELVASQKGDGYFFSVTDSGDGLPKDLAEKIMQPFFTTKDIGKGTGLGLSISKGIVESHSGRLWYNPDSPRTQFVVDLPLRQKSKNSKQNQSAA